MANETNYKFKKQVVYLEDAEAVIPANPKGLSVKGLLTCTMADTQKEEVNETLDTGGQASKKDFGKSDYAGNMELKLMGGMMPFMVTHCLGKPTSKTLANTDTWAATTVYAKYDQYLQTGDIVAHSNGTNMLVCKIAGTSDATEPDLTGLSEGDEIIDGTATWVLRPNLYKYVGSLDPCVPSFGSELLGQSGCGTVVDFKKRFEGVFIQTAEFTKATGGVIHKYSYPVIGTKATDNVEDTNFASIEDEVGYTEQEMVDFAYSYDDLKVTIGGSEPVNSRNFRMTINRGTTVEDGVAIDSKVSDRPNATVDGEVDFKFTKEQYESAFKNEEAEVIAAYGKQNGDGAFFRFPRVQKTRMDPTWSTSEVARLTVPLTAYGDDTNRTVYYQVISAIDYD